MWSGNRVVSASFSGPMLRARFGKFSHCFGHKVVSRANNKKTERMYITICGALHKIYAHGAKNII
jgi:hypothetical protein